MKLDVSVIERKLTLTRFVAVFDGIFDMILLLPLLFSSFLSLDSCKEAEVSQ